MSIESYLWLGFYRYIIINSVPQNHTYMWKAIHRNYSFNMVLFYYKLAVQSLLCPWSDLTAWKELFTNRSDIHRCLTACAALNAVHLHLSALRWEQTWRLPISLCVTIWPATVGCFSAILCLPHRQQTKAETTIFVKTASWKGCLSWKLTEAWVYWPKFIVEHTERPLKSGVKTAALKGDLCLWIFSFDVLVSYFLCFVKWDLSYWVRWSWKSTGGNAVLLVQVFSSGLFKFSIIVTLFKGSILTRLCLFKKGTVARKFHKTGWFLFFFFFF